MPASLLLPALLFMAGCKQGSTLEKYASQVASAKTIAFKSTVTGEGKTLSLEAYREKPNRIRIKMGDFRTVVNDKDGLLELDVKSKRYIQLPWYGKFATGSGDICPRSMAFCAPAIGLEPFALAPKSAWKKQKGKSGDLWRAEIDSPDGKRVFEYEFDGSGNLARFLFNDMQYQVEKSEFNASINESDFQEEIPDGSVPIHAVPDVMEAQAEGKFDPARVNAPAAQGWTLYVFVDPADSLYPKMQSWLSESKNGYKVEQVKLTNDPKLQTEFWKLVSATPTMLLVNKDSVIKALWQGFDAAETAKLNQEINKAIVEHN